MKGHSQHGEKRSFCNLCFDKLQQLQGLHSCLTTTSTQLLVREIGLCQMLTLTEQHIQVQYSDHAIGMCALRMLEQARLGSQSKLADSHRTHVKHMLQYTCMYTSYSTPACTHEKHMLQHMHLKQAAAAAKCSPVSSLLLTSRHWRAGAEPRSAGKEPVRVLLAMSQCVSRPRLLQESGRVPGHTRRGLPLTLGDSATRLG